MVVGLPLPRRARFQAVLAAQSCFCQSGVVLVPPGCRACRDTPAGTPQRACGAGSQPLGNKERRNKMEINPSSTPIQSIDQSILTPIVRKAVHRDTINIQ
jgi:hypothetical protein